MTKEEILYWVKRYNNEEDLNFPNFERELGKKIRKERTLSKKSDLINILRWKFQGSLKGRGEYFIGKLNNSDFSDSDIKKLTRKAFYENGDKKRVELLDKIPGVGPAVASVILAFYEPKDYGVLDIHVWRELFNKEPGNLNVMGYLLLLEELRNIAKMHNLSVRTVEKALFKKNKEKAKS